MNESLALLLSLVVGLGAGFIRGLTGFGGPAFILAVMTLIYSPFYVIGKILVVEAIAASYLLAKTRRLISWKNTLALSVPTLLTMPIGYRLLELTEPLLMRRLIAAATLLSCVLLIAGARFRLRLTTTGLIATGLVGGVVLGASYIALLVVAVILMSPYSKDQVRGLLISWGFLTAIWFLLISVAKGHTQWLSIGQALPLAACYFIGAWAGARLFQRTPEKTYRDYAIVTLAVLSLLVLFQ